MPIKNHADLFEMNNKPGIILVGHPGITIPQIDRVLKQDITRFLDRRGHEFIDTDENQHNKSGNIRTYALFNDRRPYAELALNKLGTAFLQGERLEGNTPQGRSSIIVPRLGLYVNPVRDVNHNLRQVRDDLYEFLTR